MYNIAPLSRLEAPEFSARPMPPHNPEVQLVLYSTTTGLLLGSTEECSNTGLRLPGPAHRNHCDTEKILTSVGHFRGAMLRLLIVLLCLRHIPASDGFPSINVLKKVYGQLIHRANPLPRAVSLGAATATDNSQTCPNAPGYFFLLGNTTVRATII